VEWFVRRLYYLSGNFEPTKKPTLSSSNCWKQLTRSLTPRQLLLLPGTDPTAFGPIVESLGAAGLIEQSNGQWRRVIIEKPFGHDLDSARALNKQLLKVADEKARFIASSLLGKETSEHPGLPLRQRIF